MARFRLGEKVYELSVQKPTLKTIMVFNRDAAEFGYDFTRLAAEMESSEADEIDPLTIQGAMILGAMVWLSRRDAGEDVGLSEALDLDLSDFTWLPDPGDHRPGPTKAGAKAPANKKAKVKASVPAADATPDAVRSTT